MKTLKITTAYTYNFKYGGEESEKEESIPQTRDIIKSAWLK